MHKTLGIDMRAARLGHNNAVYIDLVLDGSTG